MKLEKIQNLIENIEKSGYEIVEFKEDTKVYDGWTLDEENVFIPSISLKIVQSKNSVSSRLYD